jgi:hypothetical protein
VDAASVSGLPIEVTKCPDEGGHCHFDRFMTFLSMGTFEKPGMLYLMTSDEDRMTPVDDVMWMLEAQVPVMVYLNFLSTRNVTHTGVAQWLLTEGWQRDSSMKGTRSTTYDGFPGVSGPVYSQKFEPGTINLKGSNSYQDTYLVFIQPMERSTAYWGSHQEMTHDGRVVQSTTRQGGNHLETLRESNEQQVVCELSTLAETPRDIGRQAEHEEDRRIANNGVHDATFAMPVTPDGSTEFEYEVLTPPLSPFSPDIISPRSLFTTEDEDHAKSQERVGFESNSRSERIACERNRTILSKIVRGMLCLSLPQRCGQKGKLV